MRRPWTGRRSSSRGARRPARPSPFAGVLTAANSGLVLGSSYLATSLPTTFALDRPLHTVAVVLLLAGLAVVAYESSAWAQKYRRQPQQARYVAIPLAEGNGRPSSEEPWPLEDRSLRAVLLPKRALAALLALLLLALGGRIALFHAILKDVECTGPSPIVCHAIPLPRHVVLTSAGLPPPRAGSRPRFPPTCSASGARLER